MIEANHNSTSRVDEVYCQTASGRLSTVKIDIQQDARTTDVSDAFVCLRNASFTAEHTVGALYKDAQVRKALFQRVLSFSRTVKCVLRLHLLE